MSERCETCRFWRVKDVQREGTHPDEIEGYCRRNPAELLSPVVHLLVVDDKEYHDADESEQYRFDMLGHAYNAVDSSSAWAHPVTPADDWCGEWRAKDATPSPATDGPSPGGQ